MDTNEFQVMKTSSYVIAPYNQNVQEQKLIILCASKIEDMIRCGEIDIEKPHAITFKLPINEVISFLDSNSNDIYKQIRKSCKKLLKNKMYYENGNDFKYAVPFPYAEYNSKKGIVTIRSEESIWSLLIEFSNGYIKYMSGCVNKFTSKFSIKMYEVLKSKQYLKSWKIEIQEFKHIIGVLEPLNDDDENVTKSEQYEYKDKYPVFGNFKQKVLTPSLEDINLYSDIFVEYEPKKTGKPYTHLEFTIKSNPKNISKSIPKKVTRTRIVIPKELQSLVDELKEFMPKCTKNSEYLELLKVSNNSVEAIRDMWNYTQNRDKKKKIGKKINYMLKGLEEGWLDDVAITEDQSVITKIGIDNANRNINKPKDKNAKSKVVNTSKTKNKFNDFPQREYTKEDYEQMELAMMDIDWSIDDSNNKY